MPILIIPLIIVATNFMSSSVVYQRYEAPYQPIVYQAPKIDKTLEAIIACESSGNKNAIGSNRNGTKDWGLLQVNDVHRKRMSEMNLNIENPDDSYAFGLILYKEQGTQPWKSSERCWQ